MSNTRTSRAGSLIAFIISGLFVAAAGWILLNRQYALDQLSVWSYTPSSAVQAIDQKIKLTDKGQFIFYATKPAVEAQTTFNKECPRQEAGSPILGCYTNDDHIYIYNMTNQQLAGIEEVTATHEMLHAVWYRTSAADKAKLETELRAAYAKINDADIKQRMDYYQRTEPGEFANELHSILGTEVSSLGEPLESYYNQYFNRSAVLALHAQYKAVYTALYDRADTLYSEMGTLASSIQARSTAYEAAVQQYVSDVNAFNAKATSGGFSSQGQFSSARAELIARSDSLDAERVSINSDIATYNNYYNEYQDIAKQIEVLNQSIDSFNQVQQAPSV